MSDLALGQMITDLRRAQHIEIRDLAHQIGVAPVYLSRLERGKESTLSGDAIEKMATLLAVDKNLLLTKFDAQIRATAERIALATFLSDWPDEMPFKEIVKELERDKIKNNSIVPKIYFSEFYLPSLATMIMDLTQAIIFAFKKS